MWIFYLPALAINALHENVATMTTFTSVMTYIWYAYIYAARAYMT